MERGQVQKYIDIVMKGLFTLLFVLFILTIASLEATKKPDVEIEKILAEQNKSLQLIADGKQLNENLPASWPAKMNAPYPEIVLFDQKGESFKLSSLSGKVVILEYIDINSPISQAQSGAGLLGAYGSVSDIDKFALPFTDVLHDTLGDEFVYPGNEDIIEVKIIVYGEAGGPGSRDEAQNWASHFGLTREQNIIVAVARNDIRGKESDTLIGGYQLLDKNMLLRVDSSGPMPKHNLSMTLVPLVPKLLR